jgi:hypothetical protein
MHHRIITLLGIFLAVSRLSAASCADLDPIVVPNSQALNQFINNLNCANKVTLLIREAIGLSANNFIVPSNYALKFNFGGYINGGSYNIRIDGPIEAPIGQIFDGSMSVDFSKSPMTQILPQWWGAQPNDANDDHASIQKAATAAHKSNRTLYFIGGEYQVGDEIVLGGDPTYEDNGIWIKGERARLKATASNTKGIFRIQGADPYGGAGAQVEDIHIEGLYLQGLGTSSLFGIKIFGAHGVWISNMSISAFRTAINTINVEVLKLTNSWLKQNNIGLHQQRLVDPNNSAKIGEAADSYLIAGNSFSDTYMAIKISAANSVVIEGNNLASIHHGIQLYSDVNINGWADNINSAVIKANRFEGDAAECFVRAGNANSEVQNITIEQNDLVVQAANFTAMEFQNTSSHGIIRDNRLKLTGSNSKAVDYFDVPSGKRSLFTTAVVVQTGETVVSGTSDTSGDVLLNAPQENTNYQVIASPRGYIGNLPTNNGSFIVKDIVKSSSSFKIKVLTPPGDQSSVKYDWMLLVNKSVTNNNE